MTNNEFASLSSRDARFFKIAKKMSYLSTFNKKPSVGCVVVVGNKILSVGYNTEKTSPLQNEYSKYMTNKREGKFIPKMHAECNALQKIKDLNISWNKVKVYTYRNLKKQDHGLSRPCPMCMKLMQDFGIKHIYYSTDNGFSHEIIL